MSSVLDETSIRTSWSGMTQANGSRSLVWPLEGTVAVDVTTSMITSDEH